MSSIELRFEIVGPDKAPIVQEIYFNSPTYFRRVDGSEPMEGMAIKDILDVPPKHGVNYVKVAALIFDENNIPIGYADLHVNYRCMGMVYLGLLILREDIQGKGLGRRSYNLIEKYLLDHFDTEKIYLGVSNHNQVQDYWEKMGFIPNGFTYAWKGENKESVVTELEKQLKPAKLRLEQPSQALYESFLEFVEDMRSNKQIMWTSNLPSSGESAVDFIKRMLNREQNPEQPYVPETIYWATYDGHVVGRISLRHRLEGNLHKVGGHIGYEVGPKWHRRGFATEMLRQVLKTPKAIEIGKLLLTCSPNNEASNKTILKNGGIFYKTIFVEFLNEDRNHYWITTVKDNFKIEPVLPHEVSTITKLVNVAYKELADMALNYTATYQNDDKTKERVSKGRCFVLKDSSDKILGTILMTVENYFTNSNTAYLGQFGVLPEFKKNGLGTKLMEFCENLAMEEGFSGIQLDTAIPAKHLVDWYQRRGYKIVGQEHYDGKTYDSYVFEKTFLSQWERYFLKNKGRDLRPLFNKAISFAADITSDKTALDIGSGIGIEALALIDKGYRVTAIDNQIASQKHIENELSANGRLNFKFILSDFSDFHFDQQYDFIWAYHSLPFCNEESFSRVAQDSVKSVKSGGVFAGSFFGDQDEWSISKRANGLSKKQLDEIFSNFEILEMKETLEKGKLALGGEKFWHIFDVIARKR